MVVNFELFNGRTDLWFVLTNSELVMYKHGSVLLSNYAFVLYNFVRIFNLKCICHSCMTFNYVCDTYYQFRILLNHFVLTFLLIAGMATGSAAQHDVPELLDRHTNARHRSYLSAVCQQELGTLRPRVAMEVMRLDPRWIQRYVVIHFFYYIFSFIVNFVV